MTAAPSASAAVSASASVSVSGAAPSASPAVFSIEHVQLQFAVANIIDMVVNNNILVLACAPNRIVRIDLTRPQDVNEVVIRGGSASSGPGRKTASDSLTISRIFSDPSGSHLIVSTTKGDNYYINLAESGKLKPRPLPKLRGAVICAVSWAARPPSDGSTGELLLGTTSGLLLETRIQLQSELFRRPERYVRQIWKASETVGNTSRSAPIAGIYSELGTSDSEVSDPNSAEHSEPSEPSEPSEELRRLLVATPDCLHFWHGPIGPADAPPRFGRLIGSRAPGTESFDPPRTPHLATFPPSGPAATAGLFAWLTGSGVVYGSLDHKTPGRHYATVFGPEHTHSLPTADLTPAPAPGAELVSTLLTPFHVLLLTSAHELYAVNRLSGATVFRAEIPAEPHKDPLLGMVADAVAGTFWVFGAHSVWEIVVRNEQKDMWRSMVAARRFNDALSLIDPNDAVARDTVRCAQGRWLFAAGDATAAARAWGRSSEPFEAVVLRLLQGNHEEALLLYLEQKLRHSFAPGAGPSRADGMHRAIICALAVELYMQRLDRLEQRGATDNADNATDYATARSAFAAFVAEFHTAFDRATTYETIAAHARPSELLLYADAIADHDFVLAHWVARGEWEKALAELRAKGDPETVYSFATVLLTNAPDATVATWKRMEGLEPRKLVPALLAYQRAGKSGGAAEAYLRYAIGDLGSTDAIVHNTLLALYITSPEPKAEAELLKYLEQYGDGSDGPPEYYFDQDFVLRLCMQHRKVQPAVHIYAGLGLYEEAVRLALGADLTELAARIADRPVEDAALRKRLWLAVAEAMIAQTELKYVPGSSGGAAGVKAEQAQKHKYTVAETLKFLRRCELLTVKDLLPLFPDFAAIDDFKAEICGFLQDHASHLQQLQLEMEESVSTAEAIKQEITSYNRTGRRFALVEPGESCSLCQKPLVSRRFYVFPCQHGMHSDCLIKTILGSSRAEGLDYRLRQKLQEIQISRRNGKLVDNEAIDEIISTKCVLCSDIKIASIEDGFVSARDQKEVEEWEL